ncbi:glycosyltransferase family 2 protein [Granulosicoccaceae sp. 1_MG-2023]|nr:glycosyltransferase family 2 protein [Granulosicoccaceae sp. 1_MG-2023]
MQANPSILPVVYDYKVIQWRPGVLRLDDRDGRARYEFSSRALLPGWYMIEMAVSHDRDVATSVIHAESRRADCPASSYFIPCKQGRVSKRLCYIPFATARLICEPLDGPGHFRVSQLRLIWLHPGFAHDRLLRRLSAIAPQWQNRSPADIRSALRSQARQSRRRWPLLARESYEHWCSHLDPRNGYQRRNRLREPALPPVPCEPLPLTFIVPLQEAATALLQDTLDSLPDATPVLVAGAFAQPVPLPDGVRWIRVSHARSDAALVNAAVAQLNDGFVHILFPGERWSAQGAALVAPLLERAQTQWLYGDDDDLNEQGERESPRFKPAWNPDLLRGYDYIGAGAVYRVQALQKVGGWQGDSWSDARHAMHLRLAERFSDQAPLHCAGIIRHSRQAQPHIGSAVLAQLRHSLPAAGLFPGEVPGSVRIRHALPATAPKVSLLIPTRDGIDILRPCVDAILALTAYADFELLILDNQSRCKETLAYFDELTRRDSRVRVLRYDKPFNYSAINNFGARHAQGEVLGLINNDIEPLDGDWLREMVSHVMRPQVGCVGAKLYYPDDTVQHAGVVLGIGGVAGHAQKYYKRDADGYHKRLKLVQNYSAVTAACLLVRREVFEEVGGLDEEHLAVAFNDVDFCLRVGEAGYRHVWTPYAELYHHESVSRGADDNRAKRARALAEARYMRERWGQALFNDTAYNPHLTLAYEDFSLR